MSAIARKWEIGVPDVEKMILRAFKPTDEVEPLGLKELEFVSVSLHKDQRIEHYILTPTSLEVRAHDQNYWPCGLDTFVLGLLNADILSKAIAA